jgi:protein-S-isoprenylcysteine O-methyltransferase Ste14
VADWSLVARRIRVPLGFAFAILYVWLAKPSLGSLLVGLAFAIPGIVLRALASGHVQKNEALAMTGPYAYTRNPLYLGSLILAVGFAIAARSWWIGGVMVVFFAVVYIPVIRSEEVFLRSKFPEFEGYANRVPRLLPRLSSLGNDGGSFSWDLYWKHREYNAVLGALGIVAVLVAKMLWGAIKH